MSSRKGYSVAGDVLVNETADGVNLQSICEELRSALEVYNRHRSTIVRLLSYPTVAVADVIPQSVEGQSFEIATELGVPTALREPADYLRLGYNFQDYDKTAKHHMEIPTQRDRRTSRGASHSHL